jgi:hypothetical protein
MNSCTPAQTVPFTPSRAFACAGAGARALARARTHNTPAARTFSTLHPVPMFARPSSSFPMRARPICGCTVAERLLPRCTNASCHVAVRRTKV